MNVFLTIGHSFNRPGATAAPGFLFKHEHDYNTELATLIACQLSYIGHRCFVLDKSELSFKQVKRIVNSGQFWPDCYVELHCNAFNKKAGGTTILHVKGHKIALNVKKELVKALELRDRGIRKLKKGDRGFICLSGLDCPAILTEPFFIDNPEECEKVKDKMDDIALAISKGIMGT